MQHPKPLVCDHCAPDFFPNVTSENFAAESDLSKSQGGGLEKFDS